jgi:uncharacterized protein (TIGR02246 family)
VGTHRQRKALYRFPYPGREEEQKSNIIPEPLRFPRADHALIDNNQLEVPTMRKTLAAIGLLALFAVFCVTIGGGQAPAADDAPKTIRQALAGYADAFNKGDKAAMAALWAPDAEYVNEQGTLTRGRDNILALYKRYFTDLKGTKLAIKVTSIRPVKGDVILQDGKSTYSMPDGSVDDGRFTAVWTKNDGKWQIQSARDLPDEEGDLTSPAARLKELQWMIGTWESEKKGVKVSVRGVMNQAFLLMEYNTKSGDTELNVMQLIGYDPLTNQIKSWMFDSQGGYGEGLWTRDGNSWTGQTAGVLPNGQTGNAVNVMRYVDDNTVLFQFRDREVAGQPIPDAELKLVRKAAN